MQILPSYCFSIRIPGTDKDYFTTCGDSTSSVPRFQLQHLKLGIFNFDLPNTKEDMFAGLGERKGDFFLQNSTTYALYTNDNGVQDSIQTHNRRIVYSRNGAHSVIYGQHKTSSNNFAIVFGSNEGREVQFNVNGGIPSFAV